MKKRLVIVFCLIFALVLIFAPIINAESCTSDVDCIQGNYCEFENCSREIGESIGECLPIPDKNTCSISGDVCGCNKQTYPSDCHRRAEKVPLGYSNECIDEISIKDCGEQSDCNEGLECFEFFELEGVVPPRFGTKCANENPCEYFDCENYVENSVCEVSESFSFFPKKVVCIGNCRINSDCESDEFCDNLPPDSAAGICTKIPKSCQTTYSPVCGSDGITYQNDCMRKKQVNVIKNYDGECVIGISNVSCDVNDYGQDTCEFTDDCFEFPGIGGRCAEFDNVYSCPENLNMIMLMTFPIQVICEGNCTDNSECGINDYSEFVCGFNSCNASIGNCYEKKTCPDIYRPVCGCDGITYTNPCFMTNAGMAKYSEGDCGSHGINITEIDCDAQISCPSELDMQCIGFPGRGTKCAKLNPCSYYNCPLGTECGVVESYPLRVICGRECENDCDTAVSYDILMGYVEFTRNNNIQPINITLFVSGSGGILETETLSVIYFDEVILENSKLAMKTSDGEKQINILPEDAISVSETPDVKSINKMELKKESEKPIYSIKGIKSSRLFFIIPVEMEVETGVSAESGEVIFINKPWWGFLARDVKN